MAHDDRERRRRIRESEYRRGDFNRFSGDSENTRWPGESSWGYGREYDEQYPPRYGRRYEEIPETFLPSNRFEGTGRPDLTRGATEFHPQTIRHYGPHSPYGPGSLGWQPEGGFGQGSGFLYGWSPGEQGFERPTYRVPERWHSEPYFGYRPRYGYGYGASAHLVDVPRGRFTGKGPKGYQRSDERIQEDVNEELSQHGEIDATDIAVSVSNCEVTLDGEVETREQKRLAEDIVDACPGVHDVHNNLHVKKRFISRFFGTDEDTTRREAR
ncbi:MAG TPA: BON domain-containing protein [Thermoanaerobaculia bacterium]